MKVKLRFFGMLAFMYGAEQEVELQNGSTWGEAVAMIFSRFKLGQITCTEGLPITVPGYLLIFLNGKERPPEFPVQEGDEILISHPLMGG
ncbi:MAG: MoaD/ThiS family protein [Candidatus Bathyarchaeia archaeon]